MHVLFPIWLAHIEKGQSAQPKPLPYKKMNYTNEIAFWRGGAKELQLTINIARDLRKCGKSVACIFTRQL
jgi:hypothetical protein